MQCLLNLQNHKKKKKLSQPCSLLGNLGKQPGSLKVQQAACKLESPHAGALRMDWLELQALLTQAAAAVSGSAAHARTSRAALERESGSAQQGQMLSGHSKLVRVDKSQKSKEQRQDSLEGVSKLEGGRATAGQDQPRPGLTATPRGWLLRPPGGRLLRR